MTWLGISSAALPACCEAMGEAQAPVIELARTQYRVYWVHTLTHASEKGLLLFLSSRETGREVTGFSVR